jgi:hypothetical protein
MSEERESLGLVAYNYEPEFTEEEMLYITTETPVNDEPVSLEEAYAKYKNSQGDENLKQEMVKAKRQLRSAQWRSYTSQRINHAEKIMQSSQNDTKLFHQLIKRQSRNNQSIDKMIFKGDEYDDTEGILEGWWSYFTDLFGNSDQGNFDTEKIELAKI